MKKLFILGNGFDLTLGLKSSYKDFYEGYVKFCKDRNFWEILFGNNDKNWLDIEKSIEKILLDLNNNRALDLSINDILKRVSSFSKLCKGDIDVVDTLSFEHLSNIFKLYFNDELLDYLKNYENKDYTLLNVLHYELENFEKHLKDYLNNELKRYDNNAKKSTNCITYKRNAKGLLSRISDNIPPRDIEILSFNYTNFNGNIFNIHGNLENNIVIGTDLRIINQSKQLIPFTKPFKIINNRYSSSYTALKNNENISEIIFFGHSLGDTDFNYFKSIFDSVNLYDSNVILTFYIAIFDQDDEMGIISDHESKILNLLNKYSEMSTILKDGDVSLFTKLLLEGRLKIEILDYNDYCNFNINYKLDNQLQLRKEIKQREYRIKERKKKEMKKKLIEEKAVNEATSILNFIKDHNGNNTNLEYLKYFDEIFKE